MAWKRLREKHRREKDKLNSSRSGDAARHEKTWYLFPVMDFIEPCQQPRERVFMSFDAYNVVCVSCLQICLFTTGAAKCKPQPGWQLGASIQTNCMRIKSYKLASLQTLQI